MHRTVHSSTGVAPFVLMFGRQPKCIDHSSSTAFDSDSYPAHLRAKLAELQDLVESNLVQAAEHQKTNYDLQSCCRTFRTGDLVWLSRPTAGKLDPRWEGNWSVKAVKSPCHVEITDGQRTRVVHVNRLRHRVQPTANTAPSVADTRHGSQQGWNPPQVEHVLLPSPSFSPQPTQSIRRYPQRERRPPDRFS